MSDDVKQTAVKFLAEQDRLRGGPNEDLCADGYTCYAGIFPPMDFKAHAELAAHFFEAFPDLHHDVEEVIAEGDRAVVRFRIRGTNTGSLMGNPATGKSVDIGGIAIMGVKAGQVTELREEFDQMGLMQQIGLIPSE